MDDLDPKLADHIAQFDGCKLVNGKGEDPFAANPSPGKRRIEWKRHPTDILCISFDTTLVTGSLDQFTIDPSRPGNQFYDIDFDEPASEVSHVCYRAYLKGSSTHLEGGPAPERAGSDRVTTRPRIRMSNGHVDTLCLQP